ncbi:MAG: hypothetical protein ISS45_03420 [Candidatus Omnitrophica bacterium]|nr:hypothetical protein [Candidatus Omnitrophota bacterium]
MGRMSKGVRAFGIYFIVYSCLMFLARVTSVLYQLIQNIILASGVSQHRYQLPLGSLSYSPFDAIVDFIGLGLTILVFFTALKVFKLTKLALTNVKMVCAIGVVYNLAAIIKDTIKIVSYPEIIKWMSYKIAGGISMCFLSIGFWCFVFYFFNRSSIKEQF